MKPAEQIALWADKLRDMSALGLYFADNPYDQERYRALQDMAMAMSALATGESLEQMEPLRAPVFSRPTPLAVGDAAVIDQEGRILLIRRADNGKWALVNSHGARHNSQRLLFNGDGGEHNRRRVLFNGHRSLFDCQW